jgi:hypothetical protein
VANSAEVIVSPALAAGSKLGRLDLSRKQALVAHQMPDAQPHVRRKRRPSAKAIGHTSPSENNKA